MALTYDLDLRIVGGATTRYAGLTTSDFPAINLTTSTDYAFKVRPVNVTGNVKERYPWTTEATFSTLAAPLPTTVNLATVLRSAVANTIGAIVSAAPLVATLTYDLALRTVGGTTTVYKGLASSDFSAVDLTGSTDYAFKVRAVNTTGTVKEYYPWTTEATFTTLVAASPTTVNLNTVLRGATALTIAGEVSEPPAEPVVTVVTYDLNLRIVGGATTKYTGITVSEFTAVDLIDSTDYAFKIRPVAVVGTVKEYYPWTTEATFTTIAAPLPATVNLGIATRNVTANGISSFVSPAPVVFTATRWTVEVVNQNTQVATLYPNLTTTDFVATELQVGTLYKYRVQAHYLYLTSEFTDYVYFMPPNPIEYLSYDVVLAPQDVAIFGTNIGFKLDTNENAFTMSGLATLDIASITLTLNGATIHPILNGSNWSATYSEGSLGATYPDELDGSFTLDIDGLGGELAIREDNLNV